MTTATSWNSLYNFEDAFEAAAQSLLVNASVLAAASVFTQQDDGDVVTPRISLQFVVSGAEPRYMLRSSDSQPFLAAWTGELQVTIVTDRSRNKSQHSTVRAQVRKVLSQVQLWDDEDILPYFIPFEVLEGASSPTIVTEQDEDATAISFAIKFGFRTDALPSTGP